MRTFTFLIAAIAALSLMGPQSAHAVGEHVEPATELAQGQVTAWASNPLVIAAIIAQNQQHASLSQTDIDGLDNTWRAETKASSTPFIDGVLSNALSAYLKTIKEQSQGLYTEIFVMDNKGLNVGQSDVTSDYWQGDEAKWQKSYGVGNGGIHIGDVEEDESTQTFQTQVSVAISDPATNTVIGAVTVGVDIEALMEM